MDRGCDIVDWKKINALEFTTEAQGTQRLHREIHVCLVAFALSFVFYWA